MARKRSSKPAAPAAHIVFNPAHDIYTEGLLHTLQKAVKAGGPESSQRDFPGDRPHLFNKSMAKEIRNFNSTHAICLDAKATASVGMGHREEKIHEVLDPLTRFGWQDVLDVLGEDYWETGDAFLEVVRDDDDPEVITGLFPVHSERVYVVVEGDRSEDFHYVARGGDYQDIVFPRWGDSDRARELGILEGKVGNSEMIHLRRANNIDPYQGYPDYLSAVPSVELVQMMTQHEYDYFYNRGVPPYMLFAFGNAFKGCWDKIKEALQAGQGPGNSQKSAAFHIPGDPEAARIEVEKLGLDERKGDDGFSDRSQALDMRIATAHGMPPVLANILIPGKIGASNEGPNALLTIQKRKLGQMQRYVSRVFASTLGTVRFNQPTGAPVSLPRSLWLASRFKEGIDDNGSPIYMESGNGFNTVLDGMTLGARDALTRMREPLAGSSRDPSKGTLSGQDDREPQDPRGR